ncbi:MAG: ATP-binding protein [bacterium]|nr:ATP-binding protein [bacterium]
MIPRFIQKSVIKDLFKGKVILLFGPRQVGKTTLVRSIMRDVKVKSAYFNCDEPDVKQQLEGKTSTELKSFLGGAELVILDEAQRVLDIGMTLKLLVDTYPEIQIIATGSSSFDLSAKAGEPLTGRNFPYTLYPLSELELSVVHDPLYLRSTLEERLRFGQYPEIYTAESNDKERLLGIIKKDYLLKDILAYGAIRGASKIMRLLQALALQIGHEVWPAELGNMLDMDRKTVESYLDVLEQTFIIFRMPSFNRNLRKELGKRYKIFFYDLGLRNALINNFNPLKLRNDVGQMWENYIIAERMKYHSYLQTSVNHYFWRTYDQQEIDLIEEKGGKITGHEMKWNPKRKHRVPKVFLSSYPGSKVEIITPDNYRNFVGKL